MKNSKKTERGAAEKFPNGVKGHVVSMTIDHEAGEHVGTCECGSVFRHTGVVAAEVSVQEHWQGVTSGTARPPGPATSLKKRLAAALRVNVRREGIRLGANVRQDVDITDLLLSVRELGLTTALWVRPLPVFNLHGPDLTEGDWRIVDHEGEIVNRFPAELESLARMVFAERCGPFELIAGFRRFACATELELAEVPVQVIDCTPEEAADLQLLENLDREQLTALDEGKAFRERVDSKRFGATVEKSVVALAEQFHKSPAHIYDRMALLKLSAPVREAFLNGEVELSIAKEISALPGEADQVELLGLHAKTPYSVRNLRGVIELDFMISLDHAPFDLKDAALITTAGACTTCEFRTGNMVAAFPHLKTRPNFCTRPENYRLKVDAHRERELAVYREKGHRVLTAKESKPLFTVAYVAHNCGWEKSNQGALGDPKNRTWAQLAKLVKEKPAVACDGTGAVVEIFEVQPLLEALYAAKVLKKPKEQGAGSGERKELGLGFANAKEQDETPEELAARELEAAVEMETDRREALEYIAAAEGIATEDGEVRFLRWLITYLLYDGDYPFTETLRRRGLPENIDSMATMDLPTLRGFLMELQIAGYDGLQADDEPVNHRAVESLRQMDKDKVLDRKAIEKAVRKELKEKAAGHAALLKASVEKPSELLVCPQCEIQSFGSPSAYVDHVTAHANWLPQPKSAKVRAKPAKKKGKVKK